MATIINIEDRTNNEISITNENGAVFTEDDFIEEILEDVSDTVIYLFSSYGEEQVMVMLNKMKEKYENDIPGFIERVENVLEKLKKDYEV